MTKNFVEENEPMQYDTNMMLKNRMPLDRTIKAQQHHMIHSYTSEVCRLLGLNNMSAIQSITRIKISWTR
jgi:hypothetical protein